MWRVFDLKSFSLFFWKRFIIRYFHNNAGNAFAKLLDDVVFCDADIFDGIVQYRRDEHVNVVDLPDIRDQISYLERMIYIGLFIVTFSLVAGMTLSGKARCFY